MTVQAWRWRIASPGPLLTQALLVGDAARAATLGQACARGRPRLPDQLHDGTGDSSHPGLFTLPEDADGDGRIDHVLLYARAGLPAWLVAICAETTRFTIDGAAYTLEPSWMGERCEGGPFGPTPVWRAATPYFPTKHRFRDRKSTETGKRRERPHLTRDAQLAAEIAARGLGLRGEALAPESITWTDVTWLAETPAHARAFAYRRPDRSRVRPDAAAGDGAAARRKQHLAPPADALEVAAFPTVVFPTPVWGPLAFGFGAHFGLGMMEPVWEEN